MSKIWSVLIRRCWRDKICGFSEYFHCSFWHVILMWFCDFTLCMLVCIRIHFSVYMWMFHAGLVNDDTNKTKKAEDIHYKMKNCSGICTRTVLPMQWQWQIQMQWHLYKDCIADKQNSITNTNWIVLLSQTYISPLTAFLLFSEDIYVFFRNGDTSG